MTWGWLATRPRRAAGAVRYKSADPSTVEIDTFWGRGNAQILVGAIVGIAIIVVVAIH